MDSNDGECTLRQVREVPKACGGNGDCDNGLRIQVSLQRERLVRDIESRIPSPCIDLHVVDSEPAWQMS